MSNPGIAFFVSLILSSIASWPIYKLLLAAKSRQIVSPHVAEHQKKQGTPTMGGLIVVFGVLATSLFVAPWDTPWTKAVFSIFLAFALIGFADDYVVPKLIAGKRGLGWVPKLGLEVIASVGPLWIFLGNQFSGLGLAIIAFIILFAANAYNFADGMDGLAGTLGIILALTTIPLSLHIYALSGPAYYVFVLALVGALIPFLFMNANPAKLFMGDVGSLPIGALIGVLYGIPALRIVSDGTDFAMSANLALPFVIVFGILLLELVPVPLQIFWVKVFKKRLFLMTPIHHAFEKQGWPETRVVAMFVLGQLVFSLAAWLIFNTPMAPAGGQ